MSSTCNHSIFYTRQLVFVHLFNCSKRIKYLTRFATAKNIICNSYLFCVVRVRGCCWLRFFCAIFSSSADRFSSGCCWFFIYPHFCLPFYASEMALFIPFFYHILFLHMTTTNERHLLCYTIAPRRLFCCISMEVSIETWNWDTLIGKYWTNLKRSKYRRWKLLSFCYQFSSIDLGR